jgi:hypothetical protein
MHRTNEKPGQRGRPSTKPALSLNPLSADTIVETSSVPWEPVEYGLDSNGSLK